jgi:hypothetical protein
MKKIIILISFLALSFCTINCGGGSGSASSPKGENPGTPSVVKLLPSHQIAQTNSVITLHAEVLDGNGRPVRDVNVRFTNLSPIGVLSAADSKTDSGGILRIATDKKTNSNGIATVTLKSTSGGFATIQAEVNKGVAQVRDRKTVFFTGSSISQLTPTLILAVDGNDPDAVFNENEDFNLLETTGDNSVLILATLANAAFFVSGSQITFAADRPYRIGTDPDADCSDGSDDCDVRFPAGVTAVTNEFGEATIPVVVEPSTLTSLSTTLNILAQADVGAFNMITLFLRPVVIQTIDVAANPTSVESGGDSTITAFVSTNAGTPAPDGTTVNFTVSGAGSVEPFAQTTDGVAEAQFTAAEVTDTTSATVRASVGSIFDTVSISITAPPEEPAALAINPPTASSVVGICATLTFTITGGTPPYTTSSSNINRAFNDNGAGSSSGGVAGDCIRNGTELGSWTGATITVTVPAQPGTGTATAGTVDLNVSDSAGGTTTATITIQP